LRYASILAVLAILNACAATPQATPAASKATPAATTSAAASACKPPPKELVMRDLEPGSGKTVGLRSGALVFYTGWLYDGCKPDLKGAQFDSNMGQPAPFSLLVGTGKVIKGWDEGLMGMKEGGRRLLIIPPDKGYGARDVGGGKIPANSTLVFEVQVAQIPYQPPENK
jgi:FKBP-type peptidyl-prolyl cis-trans isomerase FkpA